MHFSKVKNLVSKINEFKNTLLQKMKPLVSSAGELVTILLQNYLHTILYLLGNVLIVVAVSILSSFAYGLLVAGISFIVLALIISNEGR